MQATSSRVLAITAGLVLGVSQAAIATTVASHLGMNAPSSEGWSKVPGSASGVVEGALDDGGTPVWVIDDQSNVQGSTLLYTHSVSDPDIALGNAGGWVLRVVLRVPSSDVTDDGSIFAGYRDGATGWQMNWAHDAQGDTVVKLFTDANVFPILGPTATVLGSSSYNTYELVYDPIAMSADLFINGVERISDYIGLPGGQVGNEKQVLFGAGRSAIAGEGRYREVTLSVPEPAALWVVALLALGTAVRRRA